MLMRTTDQDTEFRKQAVESMPFLVANKDPEISVMCIICLYFASQSIACRDPIARSGMLTVVGGERQSLNIELVIEVSEYFISSIS